MKFFCDRCQTKYSIADEKVRRKVLKVRCKTCSNIIEVREPSASGPMPMVGSGPAPAVSKPASPLSAAFDNAFEDMDGDGQPTQIANADAMQAAAAAAAPMQLEDEWYFAVDGNQEGPLGFRDLVDRVVKVPTGADVLVWRDGFDDWVPPASVPELKQHLKRMQSVAPPPPAPAPPPPMPPPPPAAASPPGGRLPTQRAGSPGAPAATAAAAAPAAQPVAARAAAPARAVAAAAAPAAQARPEPEEPALPAFTVEAAARAMAMPGSGPIQTSAPVATANGSGSRPAALPAPPPGPARSDAENFMASLAGTPEGHNGDHKGKLEDLVPRDPDNEFLIGEASRIVRLPQLAALPALAARPARSRPGTGAAAALPGMQAPSKSGPRPVVGGAASPGEVALPLALPLPVPADEGSGPVSEQAAFAAAAASAAATHRRRMRRALAAAAFGAVVLLVILVVALSGGSGDESSTYSGGRDHLAGVEFDEQGRVIVRNAPGPGGISISGAPTASPSASPRKSPGASLGPRPSTSPSPSGPVGLPPLPGGDGDDGERKLNLGNKTGGGPLTTTAPEAAFAQIKQSQAGVKICYERILKQDPSLKSLRKVNLSVKISSTGSVKDVGLNSGLDPTLATCISNLARGWKFPKNSADYSVEAQIILN
ncbi:MAG: zinc-ribbon domain-containing protein [Deltaproteobacteria bacterium]|nr:zinc-ribbon domain-containing protein [Deltaproteobacteria bacterium]